MKWLEFIKIRTVEPMEQKLHGKLFRSIRGPNIIPGLVKASLYKRANIIGDTAIILAWDTDFPGTGGSRLGMALARELGKSGLVDHSIWIEDT